MSSNTDLSKQAQEVIFLQKASRLISFNNSPVARTPCQKHLVLTKHLTKFQSSYQRENI